MPSIAEAVKKLKESPKSMAERVGSLMFNKGNEKEVVGKESQKEKEPKGRNFFDKMMGVSEVEGQPAPELINQKAIPVEDAPLVTEDIRAVPEDIKPTVQKAYQDNAEIPKGLLEAIVMQESSMGTVDTNRNKDIGESAWLVGMTNIGKAEIKRVLGKDVAVQSVEDAVRAMTDFIKATKGDITDPVDYYFEKYTAPENDTPEKRKRFAELVAHYANSA